MSTSDTDYSCFLRDRHVNQLVDIIRKAAVSSVLQKLENHRENLEELHFRSLLLALTTKLNTWEWRKSCAGNAYRTNCSKPIVSIAQINRCSLLLFQFIVSVIHKYQIPSVEDLWDEILNNSLTQKIEFYQYLHAKKIVIPSETRRVFSAKMSNIISCRSLKDRIKVIELGFVFQSVITRDDSIRNLEEIFSTLQQRKLLDEENINFKLWITLMNTPEKLSLFLSFFPNYDINEINVENRMNVLEQLIHMKPYLYSVNTHTNNSEPTNNLRVGFKQASLKSRSISELKSHPNDIVKYRAVRIVTLIQQLILRGARLSKPIYWSEITQANRWVFLKTSLGMYVLVGLYTKDLLLHGSFTRGLRNFVLFILKNINRFEPAYQDMMLYRLASSYSLVHQPAFINERRAVENHDNQQIHDKLFQRPIKLKDWCRLKIREHVSFNDIPAFNLPQPLINYCSFGLYDSRYGLQCVQEVERHRGHIKPRGPFAVNSIDNEPANVDEDDVSLSESESSTSESYATPDSDIEMQSFV